MIMSETLRPARTIDARLPYVDPVSGIQGELTFAAVDAGGEVRLDLRHLEEQIAQIRRAERGLSEPIVFDCGLVVNPLRWDVSISNRPLTPKLSPNEFRLLHLLAAEPDRAHKRDEIMAKLWRDQQVDPHNVDTTFSTLRRRLGARPTKDIPEPLNAGLLVNIPGRGFMMGDRAFEPTPLTYPMDLRAA